MNTTSSRIGIALVVLAGVLAVGGGGGCNVGSEGVRCNPSLSHDECGGGLACTQPRRLPRVLLLPHVGPEQQRLLPAGVQRRAGLHLRRRRRRGLPTTAGAAAATTAETWRPSRRCVSRRDQFSAKAFARVRICLPSSKSCPRRTTS